MVRSPGSLARLAQFRLVACSPDRDCRLSRYVVVVAVVLAAVIAAGCYSGPNVDHYAAVLDELAIPSGWTLIKTETRGPGGETECDPLVVPSCPAVTRYYAAGGDPVTALKDAKQVVASAGFQVDRELIPTCDGSPTGPACSFLASRGQDGVNVTVYRVPSDAGLDNTPTVGTTVLVTATGPR